MKVSEYRKVVDALGRFATTRETARGPESLIGVQCSVLQIKLIAGSSVAGVVVQLPSEDCDTTTDGPLHFSYTVDARALLQSAKILPAKETIRFKIDRNMLSVIVSGGGKLELKATDTLLNQAGFHKKPKVFTAKAFVYGESFARIARIFSEISEKVEVPSIQIDGKYAYAVAVSSGKRARYANIRLEGDGPDGYSASGYLDFWESLKSLTADGEVGFGRNGILAVSGNIECYSAPYLTSRYDPETKISHEPKEPPAWPILGTKNMLTSFKMERKGLIDIIRGQAPNDEHQRVTVRISKNAVFISAFGSETGLTIPTETTGSGFRSFRADYMTGLLRAMDSKEVTVCWGDPAKAIRIDAVEYPNWTILLAPISLD